MQPSTHFKELKYKNIKRFSVSLQARYVELWLIYSVCLSSTEFPELHQRVKFFQEVFISAALYAETYYPILLC